MDAPKKDTDFLMEYIEDYRAHCEKLEAEEKTKADADFIKDHVVIIPVKF